MLSDIFGKHPQIKVIDYMMSCPFQKFSKQQLAVGSEISRLTLDKFIDDFIEYGLLVKNNSKYIVNVKSEFIQNFFKISNNLVKLEIKKQEKLLEEEFDEITIRELDEFLSEIPDKIDLDKLEFEIESRESYTFSTDKSINKTFELSIYVKKHAR